MILRSLTHLSLVVFFIALTGFVSPSKKAKSIDWLTPEQLVEKSEKEARKVIVDIYTDWCGWCKKMDKTTFSDPIIVKYVNENYYAVKFNGQHKESIDFNGKTYNFGGRGYHELAVEWMAGKMSFPTVVYLNEDLKRIQSIPGFQKAPVMDMILRYFGDNHHKKTPWEKFQASYKSPYTQ